ncbi:MAG: hypothetical protein ACJAUG_002087 [Halioglobus sp.]
MAINFTPFHFLMLFLIRSMPTTDSLA